VCETTAAQYRSDSMESITALQWQAALRMIEGGKTDYRT
jgi:hypothetical protein